MEITYNRKKDPASKKMFYRGVVGDTWVGNITHLEYCEYTAAGNTVPETKVYTKEFYIWKGRRMQRVGPFPTLKAAKAAHLLLVSSGAMP